VEPNPARVGEIASRRVNDDPCVYPGTDVFINKEDIRGRDELEAFERVVTGHRMEHLPPKIPLTYSIPPMACVLHDLHDRVGPGTG
jgi:hypothetical protein